MAGALKLDVTALKAQRRSVGAQLERHDEDIAILKESNDALVAQLRDFGAGIQHLQSLYDHLREQFVESSPQQPCQYEAAEFVTAAQPSLAFELAAYAAREEAEEARSRAIFCIQLEDHTFVSRLLLLRFDLLTGFARGELGMASLTSSLRRYFLWRVMLPLDNLQGPGSG